MYDHHDYNNRKSLFDDYLPYYYYYCLLVLLIHTLYTGSCPFDCIHLSAYTIIDIVNSSLIRAKLTKSHNRYT